jgi:hypothetical protein
LRMENSTFGKVLIYREHFPVLGFVQISGN